MLYIFPHTKRIYGTLFNELVELPKEARLFIPFSDFFAALGLADKRPFLSVYPSENWFNTFRTLGFIPDSKTVPTGSAYIPLIATRERTALRLSKTLLDYLRPESTSVVIIGQGYSFELWDEKTFKRYEREKLEEWNEEGSIDTRLVMQKWHPWSRLRARVMVQPSEEQQYRTVAELKVESINFCRIDYVTSGRYRTVHDLGRRVISLFDAYIEGATNVPEILAVHEAYTIR